MVTVGNYKELMIWSFFLRVPKITSCPSLPIYFHRQTITIFTNKSHDAVLASPLSVSFSLCCYCWWEETKGTWIGSSLTDRGMKEKLHDEDWKEPKKWSRNYSHLPDRYWFLEWNREGDDDKVRRSICWIYFVLFLSFFLASDFIF